MSKYDQVISAKFNLEKMQDESLISKYSNEFCVELFQSDFI